PLVTKPAIGEHGDGVTVNIKDENMLIRGIETALIHHNDIIIQPFYKGEDYRIIVINHKYIAAMKRVPAHIQ
ncbi:TPA: hypothetical protein DEP21_00870, partial [Patescibacteria group bacterium]|nr:hypothetical protein [Candidatus Gracilibacteria bacterium]